MSKEILFDEETSQLIASEKALIGLIGEVNRRSIREMPRPVQLIDSSEWADSY